MPWRIESIDSFGACSGAWQALNVSVTNTPLLDRLFVASVIEQFSTGKELIATYDVQGAPRAMGILTRVSPFYWQTMQPPNAPIGLWLCDPSLDMEALLSQLVAALSPFCLMVSITQQDPDALPRPQASSRLMTFDYITTARIDFPEAFPVYWQSRSKNFRQNVNRQRNHLKRDQIVPRLEGLSAVADMRRAVADYSQLECAGWKGESNSAVRMDEPQGHFYVKLLSSFAEQGESLIYRYYFGDRLVASDLCICRADTLIILKTAYDEAHQGLSPAHLMRIDAFERLLGQGRVRRVEFFGPLKDWHTRFTDRVRTMYHLNFYRWPILKRAHEWRMSRQQESVAAPGDEDNS
jgi:CelD/BcsL family acetyltransferase involved in cellulose biosynthesis